MIGRVAPERYEGSQFPEGDEAQDQFFRQMTPNTGSYDQAVDAAALGAVMEKVREMTGSKAIYMTHSQGGGVGWDTPVENVAAIVAIEPGGIPEAGSEQYNRKAGWQKEGSAKGTGIGNASGSACINGHIYAGGSPENVISL